MNQCERQVQLPIIAQNKSAVIILRKNLGKAVLTVVLLALTIFGLFLLYKRKLRDWLLYSEVKANSLDEIYQKATHVMFQSDGERHIENLEMIGRDEKKMQSSKSQNNIDKIQSSSNLNDLNSGEEKTICFGHMGNRYEIKYSNQKVIRSPLPDPQEEYRLINQRADQIAVAKNIQRNGNSFDEILMLTHVNFNSLMVNCNRMKYGSNQPKVEIPRAYIFFAKNMVKPFFLSQVFATTIYSLQGFKLFGIILLAFSFSAIIVEYIIIYYAYKKFKDVIQKSKDKDNDNDNSQQKLFAVIRNGTKINIQKTQIVYGDLVIIYKTIPCDLVFLSINPDTHLIVNQVSLTGQSYEVQKMPFQKGKKCEDQNYIYEGTIITHPGNQVIAMAVRTGYASKRGNIIWKVIKDIERNPQFMKRLFVFFGMAAGVGVILCLATLPLLLSLDIETEMIVFRFFDYLTYSFPTPIPIFIYCALIACFFRCSNKGISVSNFSELIDSALLRHIYFDKTGTITENSIKFHSFSRLENGTFIQERAATFKQKIKEYERIHDVFAACGKITIPQNSSEPVGNHIDCEMFKLSGASIKSTGDMQQQFDFLSLQGTRSIIEHARIDYQSSKREMSVFVQIEDKLYVLIKGDAEKIHQNCSNKSQNFMSHLEQMNMQGYRSLGIAFKQIQAEYQPFKDYYEDKTNRDEILRQCIFLGIVCFTNEVKNGTEDVIRELQNADIECKMITGDNIYTAVKIAVDARLLSYENTVAVFHNEGEVTLLQIKNRRLIKKQHFDRSLNIKFDSEEVKNCVFAATGKYLNHINKFFHPRIVVYAEIKPDQKAKIIKENRLQLEDIKDKQSCLKRWFGHERMQIGMVGDGMNDLMAIRESDVGIMVTDGKDMIMPNFNIQRLDQIKEIILDSKNLARQMVEISIFFGLYNITSIVMTILLLLDSGYFTNEELLYKNFLSSIFYSGFMIFSRPVKVLTSERPTTNIMHGYYQALFWGNLALFAAASAAGFFTYRSGGYTPNPNPKITFDSGWYSDTELCTLCFMMALYIFAVLPILIYQSSPWKQEMWRNKALMLVSTANVIGMFVLSFEIISGDVSLMGMKQLDGRRFGGSMAFLLLATFISHFYNYFLNYYFSAIKIKVENPQQGRQ